MHALIDADIIVFRCGLAAERNVWHLSIPEQDYLGVFEYKREAMDQLDKLMPGVYSRKEGEDYKLWPEVDLQPLSHALNNVNSTMNRILIAIDCTDWDVKMYMSSRRNFRHDLAVTRPYKGNRDPSHRPTHEEKIKDFIKGKWDTTTGDNEEADDLLGIAQTKYGAEDSVIVSIDKDLDQIPGLKYNFVKDIRYNVTEKQAWYTFHMQLLTGDTTDNIVGLPGIGPGKAAKALHGLETPDEQMQEVLRQYQIHSGKEDWRKYLKEMGQLIWIRREAGQMWEPPEDEEEEFNEFMKELTLYE